MFVPFANVNKTAYVIKYFYETEQKHFVIAKTKYSKLMHIFFHYLRILRLYEIFNILLLAKNVLKLQHVTRNICISAIRKCVHILHCIIILH